MAISATVSLNPSQVTQMNQPVNVAVTVSNSGTLAVNVLWVDPIVTVQGLTAQSVSVEKGLPPIGPGLPVSVPAAVAGVSGTLTLSFLIIPNAPVSTYGLGAPSQILYSVSARVTTSDGAVTVSSTQTMCCQALGYVAPAGAFNFNLYQHSAFAELALVMGCV